jgi:hypothetical protein
LDQVRRDGDIHAPLSKAFGRQSKLVVVSGARGRYFLCMLRVVIWVVALCWVAGGVSARAEGKVLKVLPHLLDAKGRNSISPSLYDRDAYQAFLRLHPEARSGIRFDVEWKDRKPVWGALKLRVEVRGTAHGEAAKQMVLEESLEPSGWFGKWTKFPITGESYKELGEVTAWRATLWDGDTLLDEQKSFLW